MRSSCEVSRLDPFFAAPNRSCAATMMLVYTALSPTSAMRLATGPEGLRTKSEIMFVSSKKRLKCTQDPEADHPSLERPLRSAPARPEPPEEIRQARLQGSAVTLSTHDSVFSWKLELTWNPNSLVPPLLEKLDVPKRVHDGDNGIGRAISLDRSREKTGLRARVFPLAFSN